MAAGAASPTAGNARLRPAGPPLRLPTGGLRRLPSQSRRSPTQPTAKAPKASGERNGNGKRCNVAKHVSAGCPAAPAHGEKAARFASTTLRSRGGQRLLRRNRCQPAYQVLPLGHAVLQLGRHPRCLFQRLLMPGAERRSACREGTQRRRVYASHPARLDVMTHSNPATPAAATAPLQQRQRLQQPLSSNDQRWLPICCYCCCCYYCCYRCRKRGGGGKL